MTEWDEPLFNISDVVFTKGDAITLVITLGRLSLDDGDLDDEEKETVRKARAAFVLCQTAVELDTIGRSVLE